MPDGLLLSVEWSPGQTELDWCRAVRREDFAEFFYAKTRGVVLAYAAQHLVWTCKKKDVIQFKVFSSLAQSFRIPVRLGCVHKIAQRIDKVPQAVHLVGGVASLSCKVSCCELAGIQV
jgi:hypothetical protein